MVVTELAHSESEEEWKSWERIFRILTRFVDPSDHNISLGKHLELIDGILDLDERKRVIDWIKFLSKAGFDFDDPTEETAPALINATRPETPPSLMDLILKCGADPNISVDHEYPVHLVLLFGWAEIKECLSAYDKDTDLATEEIMCLTIAKLVFLFKAGCDIHAFNRYGQTPSMLAEKLDLLVLVLWRKALELCDIVYEDVVAADTEILRRGRTSGAEFHAAMRDRTYLRKRR